MEILSYLIEAHIFRKRDSRLEFLLLKRSAGEKYGGVWQMVTGTIDENEKAYSTAIREIEEETGLKPKRMWVVPHINSFYSHEKDHVCLVPIFSAEVDENSSVMISSEHSEFKWLEKEEAKKLLAWDGQRKSVDIIYEYFTNKQSFFKFIEIKL